MKVLIFLSRSLLSFFFLLSRDYRGEHICADTLFSCHQRDGQYYSNPQQQSYNIATMYVNSVLFRFNIIDFFPRILVRICHSTFQSMFFSLPPVEIFFSFYSPSLSFPRSSILFFAFLICIHKLYLIRHRLYTYKLQNLLNI